MSGNLGNRIGNGEALNVPTRGPRLLAIFLVVGALSLFATAGSATALTAAPVSVKSPTSAVAGTSIKVTGSTTISRATFVTVERARGRTWLRLAASKVRQKRFAVKLQLASVPVGTMKFRVTVRRGSQSLGKSKFFIIRVHAPTVPGATTSVPIDVEGGRGSLGGDYPDADAADCSAPPPRGFGVYSWCKNGTWLSSRGYGYRNCVDYVAWVLGLPRGLGNAKEWKARASQASLTVTSSPSVGDVAWWGGGDFGHVAVVTAVYLSGAVDTVDFNGDGRGNKTTRAQTRADAYLHPAKPPTVIPSGILSGPDGAVVVIESTVHVRKEDGSLLGSFVFGNGTAAGNQYFAGDFDGDGKDNAAVVIGNVVHVRKEDGSLLGSFPFGNGTPAGNQYFAGDFDGDGKDNAAVVIGNVVHVRKEDGSLLGAFPFGNGTAAGNQYFAGHF